MTIFIVGNVTTIVVNVAEAKLRLSKYLKKVEAGETIILARRNQAIAEIRHLPKPRKSPRPMGLCAGEFKVPDDFDAPLPGPVLDAFEGR
jgi:antitoxin (DNA-binding transcriptional repressor) of toxin-antitoxin stability system